MLKFSPKFDLPSDMLSLRIIQGYAEKAISPMDHNNWLVVVDKLVQIRYGCYLEHATYSNKAIVCWLGARSFDMVIYAAISYWRLAQKVTEPNIFQACLCLTTLQMPSAPTTRSTFDSL